VLSEFASAAAHPVAGGRARPAVSADKFAVRCAWQIRRRPLPSALSLRASVSIPMRSDRCGSISTALSAWAVHPDHGIRSREVFTRRCRDAGSECADPALQLFDPISNRCRCAGEAASDLRRALDNGVLSFLPPKVLSIIASLSALIASLVGTSTQGCRAPKTLSLSPNTPVHLGRLNDFSSARRYAAHAIWSNAGRAMPIAVNVSRGKRSSTMTFPDQWPPCIDEVR